MRRLTRAAVGIAVAAVLLGAMRFGSALSVPRGRGKVAHLRLSWSARPERIEVCRTLSADELARREEHMRQRVECDGRFATYLLRVEADNRLLHESIVRGAGLRHDRPIYLLREIELVPGVHRLHVSLVRREATNDETAGVVDGQPADADTGVFAGRARREAVERARRRGAAIPPRLELDSVVTFMSERVIVVSLDAASRTLRIVE